MVIVAGGIQVLAGRRDEFVTASLPAVVQARATKGCLDFVVTIDPVDADRVVVLERWESVEDLMAFRGDGPGDDLSTMIVRVEVEQYVVVQS